MQLESILKCNFQIEILAVKLNLSFSFSFFICHQINLEFSQKRLVLINWIKEYKHFLILLSTY